MQRKYDIKGNKKSLFGILGQVEPDKVLDAIAYMTEEQVIDIDKINKYAEKGLLYITPSGRILDTADDIAEKQAKYKIVPLGMKLRLTDYPLVASFIRLNAFWEGAFIGTPIQIFEMYKNHYCGDKLNFHNEYKDIFGGENRRHQVIGFGLDDVLANRENVDTELDVDTVYEDDKSVTLSNQLEKALEKLNMENDCENEVKGKKYAHQNKKQRKQQRLKSQLEKIRQSKDTKIGKADEVKEETKEVEKETNDDNEIQWFETKSIEESDTYFEDAETKLLKTKILDYINNNDECSSTENSSKEYEQCADNIECDYELSEEELSIIRDIDCDNRKEGYAQEGEAERYQKQLKADLIQDIYERLMYTSCWNMNACKSKIGFYLKGLCVLIWQNTHTIEDDETKGNGFTYSDDRLKLIMNTGLADKYGDFVYLVDHTPKVIDFYEKKLTVMNDKASLLDFNFNIENVKNLPEPVNVIKDFNDLKFDCSIDDFDLSSQFHIKHIVEERIHRFPKKYQSESANAICERIKASLVHAIKMNKVDCRYVIPKYDFCRRKIQFLVPMYFDNDFNTSPELVLVVDKHNGMWNIYTVLYIDDAYDTARLITNPRGTWLDRMVKA